MITRTPRPRLSIVVIVYNMGREAPRTLLSLSPAYQRQIDPADYEVIVVDNGSTSPMPAKVVGAYGPNFRYLVVPDALPSPARAINYGVEHAEADHIGVMIDGARLVTPGILHHALRALASFERPVISSLAFRLGANPAGGSAPKRYSSREEDELLAAIGWPGDGYRLFEIASLAASSDGGWFLPLAESNCVLMPRTLFAELGGYDERFESPAGGLVNLDFYCRACEAAGSELVMLLGEGTFHQAHNGTTTNSTAQRTAELWVAFEEEYRRIRGKPFARPTKAMRFAGEISAASMPWMAESLRAFLSNRGSGLDCGKLPGRG